MKDVSVYLQAANSAKQSGAPAPAGDALARLKLEGEGKPEPLVAMIGAVDSATSGLTKGSERERLSALWSSQAGPFCRQAISGRYPLVRSSAQEITAQDFGNFFGPGGLVDDFFQRNLVQYVDTGGGAWRWRPAVGNVQLGFSPGILAQFQRAARIRDAFFAAGGKQTSLRFDLKTLSVDPALTKLNLEIDGQSLTYTGQPARASFQLPSGKGNGQVRFETTPVTRDLRAEGPWAWFRMLDKGVVEPTSQGERFKLNFDLDGKKVALELAASSVINPFKRDMLEQFQCMDRF